MSGSRSHPFRAAAVIAATVLWLALAPAPRADGLAIEGTCSTRLTGVPTNPLLQYSCTSGGDQGTPAPPAPSPYRYIDTPAGGTCHVIDGVGYEGGSGADGGTWVWETVYDAGTWAVVRGPYRACLVPQSDGARKRGSIPIPQPTIQTDWDHNGPDGKPVPLLTGAPVTFRMDSATHLDKQVTFDGADQSLALDATTITWNFGDGTTSSEASPTHVFQSKSPDANNPADHSVHVTLSVIWTASADTNGDGIHQVGTRTVTASFDRTIEEVWAAQTEPSPHV
jgi:hypothetical protein